MPRKKTKNNKPLTLDDLVKYNHEVLFPAFEERFVTKDEFKDFKDEMSSFKEDMYSFKSEMYAFKDRMDKFRDEAMTSFDAILKKLDILLEEKTVADYQWEKTKQLLMFLTKRLKDNNILSDKDLAVIKSLEVF